MTTIVIRELNDANELNRTEMATIIGGLNFFSAIGKSASEDAGNGFVAESEPKGPSHPQKTHQPNNSTCSTNHNGVRW